jgi:hypothetical protein
VSDRATLTRESGRATAAGGLRWDMAASVLQWDLECDASRRAGAAWQEVRIANRGNEGRGTVNSPEGREKQVSCILSNLAEMNYRHSGTLKDWRKPGIYRCAVMTLAAQTLNLRSANLHQMSVLCT